MPKEHYTGPRQSRSPYAEEATLFRILTLGEIYEIPMIAAALKELRKHVRVSDYHYDLFYRATIDRFLELVQLLPDTGGKRTRSLALEGLGRAIKAAIFTHESHKHDELEVFALVSSALLRRIGSLVSSMVVMVSERDGEYTGRFSPLYHEWGQHKGTHYKVRYRVEPVSLLKQQVSPLMAQRVLPELALTWLSDHAHVFSDWLALISEDERGAGTLGPVANLIFKVDAPFLDHLYQHDLFGDGSLKDPFLLHDDHHLGESFLSWLREKINHMEGVNKEGAAIHRLHDGWLLDYDKAFVQFCLERDINADPVVVYRQFNHLGIGKFSGQDYHFDRYYADVGQGSSVLSGGGGLFSGEGGGISSSAGPKGEGSVLRQGVVVPDTGLLPSQNVAVSRHVRLQTPPSSMADAVDRQQANDRLLAQLNDQGA